MTLYNVIMPGSRGKMARGGVGSTGPPLGAVGAPEFINMPEVYSMLSFLLFMLISDHFREHNNFFIIISQTRRLQDMW